MKLELPTLQNWSCHSCGGCCKQHLIEITPAERERIDQQDWPADSTAGISEVPYEWYAGPYWKKRYRLKHRGPDAACIFLSPEGRCRIHAKFGEAAKPLPCRVYPYAFHPAGKKLAVSLRFSCPSVVANKGQALTQQLGDLNNYAIGVGGETGLAAKPPRLSATSTIDWPLILSIRNHLVQMLERPKTRLSDRLLQTYVFCDYLHRATLNNLSTARQQDVVELLAQTAPDEATLLIADLTQHQLSTVGQTYFRLRLAQSARHDTAQTIAKGWRGRWQAMRTASMFVLGNGIAPSLHQQLQPRSFANIEQVTANISAATDELLTRYLVVKAQGLHFCGLAYDGWPFTLGWMSQLLVLPIVTWLARWRAASEQRSSTIDQDFADALMIVDHNHAYSGLLSSKNSLRQVRTLHSNNDLASLFHRLPSA